MTDLLTNLIRQASPPSGEADPGSTSKVEPTILPRYASFQEGGGVIATLSSTPPQLSEIETARHNPPTPLVSNELRQTTLPSLSQLLQSNEADLSETIMPDEGQRLDETYEPLSPVEALNHADDDLEPIGKEASISSPMEVHQSAADEASPAPSATPASAAQSPQQTPASPTPPDARGQRQPDSEASTVAISSVQSTISESQVVQRSSVDTPAPSADSDTNAAENLVPADTELTSSADRSRSIPTPQVTPASAAPSPQQTPASPTPPSTPADSQFDHEATPVAPPSGQSTRSESQIVQRSTADTPAPSTDSDTDVQSTRSESQVVQRSTADTPAPSTDSDTDAAENFVPADSEPTPSADSSRPAANPQVTPVSAAQAPQQIPASPTPPDARGQRQPDSQAMVAPSSVQSTRSESQVVQRSTVDTPALSADIDTEAAENFVPADTELTSSADSSRSTANPQVTPASAAQAPQQTPASPASPDARGQRQPDSEVMVDPSSVQSTRSESQIVQRSTADMPEPSADIDTDAAENFVSADTELTPSADSSRPTANPQVTPVSAAQASQQTPASPTPPGAHEDRQPDSQATTVAPSSVQSTRSESQVVQRSTADFPEASADINTNAAENFVPADTELTPSADSSRPTANPQVTPVSAAQAPQQIPASPTPPDARGQRQPDSQAIVTPSSVQSTRSESQVVQRSTADIPAPSTDSDTDAAENFVPADSEPTPSADSSRPAANPQVTPVSAAQAPQQIPASPTPPGARGQRQPDSQAMVDPSSVQSTRSESQIVQRSTADMPEPSADIDTDAAENFVSADTELTPSADSSRPTANPQVTPVSAAQASQQTPASPTPPGAHEDRQPDSQATTVAPSSVQSTRSESQIVQRSTADMPEPSADIDTDAAENFVSADTELTPSADSSRPTANPQVTPVSAAQASQQTPASPTPPDAPGQRQPDSQAIVAPSSVQSTRSESQVVQRSTADIPAPSAESDTDAAENFVPADTELTSSADSSRPAANPQVTPASAAQAPQQQSASPTPSGAHEDRQPDSQAIVAPSSVQSTRSESQVVQRSTADIPAPSAESDTDAAENFVPADTELTSSADSSRPAANPQVTPASAAPSPQQTSASPTPPGAHEDRQTDSQALVTPSSLQSTQSESQVMQRSTADTPAPSADSDTNVAENLVPADSEPTPSADSSRPAANPQVTPASAAPSPQQTSASPTPPGAHEDRQTDSQALVTPSSLQSTQSESQVMQRSTADTPAPSADSDTNVAENLVPADSEPTPSADSSRPAANPQVPSVSAAQPPNQASSPETTPAFARLGRSKSAVEDNQPRQQIKPLVNAQPSAPPQSSTTQPTAAPRRQTAMPTIQVSIGRIEIRASRPTLPPPRPAASQTMTNTIASSEAANSALFSLSDYLKQRSGGIS